MLQKLFQQNEVKRPQIFKKKISMQQIKYQIHTNLNTKSRTFPIFVRSSLLNQAAHPN